MSEITALLVRCGETTPETVLVENSTKEAVRDFLGHDIHTMHVFADPRACIVCPKDGNYSLKANRFMSDRHDQIKDILFGDFLIIGEPDNGEFTSLAGDLQSYMRGRFERNVIRWQDGFNFDATNYFTEGNDAVIQQDYNDSIEMEYHADTCTIVGRFKAPDENTYRARKTAMFLALSAVWGKMTGNRAGELMYNSSGNCGIIMPPAMYERVKYRAGLQNDLMKFRNTKGEPIAVKLRLDF